MRHFKTYCTSRIIRDCDPVFTLWSRVIDFEKCNPNILRRVEHQVIKTLINNETADVLVHVWLFAGSLKEFVQFVRDQYEAEGMLQYFTPGGNGYEIREAAIALTPVGKEPSLISAYPLPKIRTQLAAPNFLTHCEDDFPDVDVNLSNNSFTLPLNEAVKLANQILRIADFHDSYDQKSANKSSAAAKLA